MSVQNFPVDWEEDGLKGTIDTPIDLSVLIRAENEDEISGSGRIVNRTIDYTWSVDFGIHSLFHGTATSLGEAKEAAQAAVSSICAEVGLEYARAYGRQGYEKAIKPSDP